MSLLFRLGEQSPEVFGRRLRGGAHGNSRHDRQALCRWQYAQRHSQMAREFDGKPENKATFMTLFSASKSPGD
ncbi:hypothetical protein [Azohydromonas lata]|uniref:Uncharacterized protein n=1 Tax=Azohydromonas lata TaxID=45677 RepID=A0ABU5IAY9_9BURK|nr:hypothetical protein [Azohydromonas lata]MDZ5456265.1 hypothetical protein [Azohydromonas lata]